MHGDHTLEISLLGRLREEDCELKATMSYVVRPCLKIKSQKNVLLIPSYLHYTT